MELPLSIYISIVYNAILIIVDRFLKIIQYILIVNTINAISIDILIIDHIISKFEVSKLIVSDRDSIFISSY